VAYSRRIDAEVLPSEGVCPPSITMVVPVMQETSSEARNSAALATSQGVPSRPRGIAASMLRMNSAPVRLHSFGQDIAWLDARELHRIERHRSTSPPRGHLSHESFLQLIADLESDSMRVFTSAFESVKNQIETVQKTAHT
jgi:hypothetical protein